MYSSITKFHIDSNDYTGESVNYVCICEIYIYCTIVQCTRIATLLR